MIILILIIPFTLLIFFFFFLNNPTTTKIYTLPLHAPLPISIPPLKHIKQFPPGLYKPPFPASGLQFLRPDGPQMLSTFIGQSATPVWTLDMVDNARFHTGRSEEHTSELQSPCNIV